MKKLLIISVFVLNFCCVIIFAYPEKDNNEKPEQQHQQDNQPHIIKHYRALLHHYLPEVFNEEGYLINGSYLYDIAKGKYNKVLIKKANNEIVGVIDFERNNDLVARVYIKQTGIINEDGLAYGSGVLLPQNNWDRLSCVFKEKFEGNFVSSRYHWVNQNKYNSTAAGAILHQPSLSASVFCEARGTGKDCPPKNLSHEVAR